MTDNEGTLQRATADRWGIAWPGLKPVTIPHGEVFLLEVAGELKRTRIEYRSGDSHSVDGYPLRAGLRASFFDERERHANPLRDLGP